ncbi:MAG: hypothetical protein KJ747_00405 [Actinobacteria bacterium]|nr:hypothetical protein [Actinomycetota bacterium]MCG2808703.1 hypothetical protein [Coriobacteriia bacterium]
MRAVPAHVAACFSALEQAALPYAVLHQAHRIPDSIDSDIDIVVADGKMSELTALLRRFAEEQGGVLCQVIRHETTARYHVLALPDEFGTPAFVKIDASTDFRRDGRVVYTSDELFSATRVVGCVTAVSVGVEFAAYLAKRILKESIERSQFDALSQLWGEDPAACRSQCAHLFGPKSLELIASVFDVRNAPVPMDRLLTLRGAVLRGALARHPIGALTVAVGRPVRLAGRIMRRTGFQVAVLGPDGVGKSTLLAGLGRLLEPTVRRVEILHLRPGLLPARGAGDGGSSVPYARPVLGYMASILKLAYLLLDYCLGYWLSLWPKLLASTLLLCDRYYLDVVADPQRYRYGGPSWLPGAAAALVAGPDLYVVLSADTDEVQLRKAEVGPEITSSQNDAYARLSGRTHPVERIDASGSPQAVLNRVSWLVLRSMAKRGVNRR